MPFINLKKQKLTFGEHSKDKIAKRLNMCERTLQGHLAIKNTSYRDLLNEMRKKLAEQYIGQELRSFSEVTCLLGFSGISRLLRAFQNWTGLSPSVYRGQCHNKYQLDHG